MSQPNPELLILAVALVALALAPLASRLVGRIGEQISSELDGGRSGQQLHDHLDAQYEGTMHADEVAQMREAYAYLRGDEAAADAALPPGVDPDLRDEVRQLVVASNERRERMGEPLLDVEAEVVRRLAELLGTNGHSRT